MPNCALCNREAESFENNIERWVFSVIKQQRPDWSVEDGACRRCVRYYESLVAVISLVQSHELD